MEQILDFRAPRSVCNDGDSERRHEGS